MATLNGVEAGDDVILGGSPVFTFASANVGTGITINTSGYTISGTDSGNYTLTQPTLSGDITAKELTITGISGCDQSHMMVPQLPVPLEHVYLGWSCWSG